MAQVLRRLPSHATYLVVILDASGPASAEPRLDQSPECDRGLQAGKAGNRAAP